MATEEDIANDRHDDQERAIIDLQKRVAALECKVMVKRDWLDEITGILDYFERNRTSIFGTIALLGLIGWGFTVSNEQRSKLFDRLTSNESLATLAIAATGATVVATKKS